MGLFSKLKKEEPTEPVATTEEAPQAAPEAEVTPPVETPPAEAPAAPEATPVVDDLTEDKPQQ